jgi:hypothetical protein
MKSNVKPLSLPAWALAEFAVLVCALVSWIEGTFIAGPVTMGFANHGGMWGDVLFLPVIAAVIVPVVRSHKELRPSVKVLLVLVSAVATLGVHWQWATIGRELGTTDHVFPSHAAGTWLGDMSVAGWLHVAYMTAFLALVFAYAIISVPAKVVWITSAILTLHLLVGQLQPAWYSTGTLMAPTTLASVVATVLAVWVVAAWKLLRTSVESRSV